MNLRSARFALAVVLGWSCADAMRPELSIYSDATSYVVPQPDGGPFVRVSLRNESSRTMLLAACAGTDLIPVRQRMSGGVWADHPLAECVERFEPRELAAGEVISLGHWNFFGATGNYRFRAAMYVDSATWRPSREVSATITVALNSRVDR